MQGFGYGRMDTTCIEQGVDNYNDFFNAKIYPFTFNKNTTP